jgi:endonuclease YncB( thermonuclease family)
MAHDFKAFPELRNSQMDFYYFQSPHKQIFEGFTAKVVKVTDGDTIRVTTNFRDFDFPIRLAGIAAPELDEKGGVQSQEFLSRRILGEEVYIAINPFKRVGKWGRLLGDVIHAGESMSEASMREGRSIDFFLRESGRLE